MLWATMAKISDEGVMNELTLLLIAGVWCVLAYLVGSISFAIVLSKWFGICLLLHI